MALIKTGRTDVVVAELRGHHLGIIYNVFARVNGQVDNTDRLRAAIAEELDFIKRHSHYGSNLTQMVSFLLGHLFINRHLVVRIIYGLDDLCKSDCQELADEEQNRDLINLGCLNPHTLGDKYMLLIFGLDAEREYDYTQIMDSLRGVWVEYNQIPRWYDVLRKFISLNSTADCHMPDDSEEEIIGVAEEEY